MSAPLRIDGFEAVFAQASDPWGTFSRRDEAIKRKAVLRASGHIRGRVLELACGNGSNTAALQALSLRLLATDGAPSAVALTQGVAGPRTIVMQTELPLDAPGQPFDLIVIAEVLYYLSSREIAQLGRRLTLAPGGRLVLAHHHVDFDDTSSRPSMTHMRLVQAMQLDPTPQRRIRTNRWRVEAFQNS